jgi:hypothetical protein
MSPLPGDRFNEPWVQERIRVADLVEVCKPNGEMFPDHSRPLWMSGPKGMCPGSEAGLIVVEQIAIEHDDPTTIERLENGIRRAKGRP